MNNDLMYDLWFGTYPDPHAEPLPDGTPAEGIWHALFDVTTGKVRDARLVQHLAAPSFLAFGDHTDLIYAVDELTEGKVSVCRIVYENPDENPELTLVAQVPTGGSDPCHLHIQPGLGIIVANYAADSTGSVAVIRLNADGLPEPGAPHQVITLNGSGPNPQRQSTSHAHFILPVRDCPDEVLVSDLGADQVRRYRVDHDARLLVDEGVAVSLPPGVGPRHTVFSEDGRWLYIVGELDGRVHRARWDADSGTGECVDSQPVAGRVDDSDAQPLPSHITATGTILTVGVRGTDVLSLHQVNADGSLGEGTALSLPGTCPRHHAAIGPWYLVTQQSDGGIAVLDGTDSVIDTVPIPVPACVLARVLVPVER